MSKTLEEIAVLAYRKCMYGDDDYAKTIDLSNDKNTMRFINAICAAIRKSKPWIEYQYIVETIDKTLIVTKEHTWTEVGRNAIGNPVNRPPFCIHCGQPAEVKE